MDGQYTYFGLGLFAIVDHSVPLCWNFVLVAINGRRLFWIRFFSHYKMRICVKGEI